MEKQIIAAVKSVLPDVAVYHDYAPEEAALPLVIIQRVGGGGHVFLDEPASGGYEVRFYVSIWAQERLPVVAMSQTIEAALLALQGVWAPAAAVALSDPDSGRRGMGQDFFVVA